MAEQTYKTHVKYVPLYHFVTFGILAVNLLWALYRLFRGYPAVEIPFFDRLLAALVAFALVLVALFARVFALKVQDRVIRGEMRARLAALLPPDLQPRIDQLTVGQLIALRFASDGELPELARQVLDGQIGKPDDIKRQVRQWRADDARA
jgi:dolichyl-phosphate-mannose--protein O-mannosyl transferase